MRYQIVPANSKTVAFYVFDTAVSYGNAPMLLASLPSRESAQSYIEAMMMSDMVMEDRQN